MSECKAKILFVDDEPRILHALKMLFRKGYEVETAEGGEEALELIKTFKPDVVVSDQRMPGMTGTQLLSQVKVVSPGTIRLLLTGYSDYKAIVSSVNDGEVYRFVQKPWVNSKIRDVIGEAAEVAIQEHVDERTEPEVKSLLRPGTASGGNLMVIDDDIEMCEQLQKLLGEQHNIIYARSLSNAMDLLEVHKVEVIISEVSVAGGDVTQLIKLLKRHHPEIVTVVITSHEDATTIIDLINQGQIYRFMSKPVRSAQCRINIESALKKHRVLMQSPQQRERYKVEVKGDEESISIEPTSTADVQVSAGVLGSLLGRVKGLRSLWA